MQIDNTGSASGKDAVEHLGKIAIEREKTRRLLLLSSVVFVLMGAAVILFAPTEKQFASQVIAGVLLVFSVGAVGASSFKIKLPGIEVSGKS